YKEEIISDQEPFSEWQIKNIHRLVLKGIDDSYAGVYREEQVFISGAAHIPHAGFLIKEEMENMMDWYRNEGSNINAIERRAMLHFIFVGIHQFIDVNGRTARHLL